MTFSQKTFDFLAENYLRNDREWYRQHRDDYKEYVLAPMEKLVTSMADTFAEIDPLIECNPKRISRVYRDARTLAWTGQPFFRDHIWCHFGQSRIQSEGLPGFFVCVMPQGFEYGMGYYQAARQTMESMRSLISREDPAFQRALDCYETQKLFTLYGDKYKRNRYGGDGENIAEWYNRKNIGVIRTLTEDGDIFTENLAQTIREGFLTITPIYEFLMKAESLWREG